MKVESITTKLTPDDFVRVKRIAKQLNQSISAITRDALLIYITILERELETKLELDSRVDPRQMELFDTSSTTQS